MEPIRSNSFEHDCGEQVYNRHATSDGERTGDPIVDRTTEADGDHMGDLIGDRSFCMLYLHIT